MNFTNTDSVLKEIDGPRYWETHHIHLYRKIGDKRMGSQVYTQPLQSLYIRQILSIQNTISQEIKR